VRLVALGWVPESFPVVASLSARLRACTQVCKPGEMLLRVAQTLNSGPAKKPPWLVTARRKKIQKHRSYAQQRRKPSRRHSCRSDSVVIVDTRRGACGPPATKDGKTPEEQPAPGHEPPRTTQAKATARMTSRFLAPSPPTCHPCTSPTAHLPTARSLAPCSLPFCARFWNRHSGGSAARASLSIICYAGALAMRVADVFLDHGSTHRKH